MDLLPHHGRVFQPKHSFDAFPARCHLSAPICSVCCRSGKPCAFFRMFCRVAERIPPIQLIGAICASAVLLGILPGPLAVNTFPNNGTGTAQALFYGKSSLQTLNKAAPSDTAVSTEMFLTFGLCMTVIMLSVEKNKTTPLGPVAIGLALFSTQLAGIFFTGAAVNTARAFGPAVVTSFDGTHWIYWVGPSLGAILAAGLYKGMHAVHCGLSDISAVCQLLSMLHRLGTHAWRRRHFACTSCSRGERPTISKHRFGGTNNRRQGADACCVILSLQAPVRAGPVRSRDTVLDWIPNKI